MRNRVDNNRAVPTALITLVLLCAGFSSVAQGLDLISIADPALRSSVGSGDSAGPVLSPDGRFVLFASSAENLVLLDTNGVVSSRLPHPLNVYLYDRLTGSNTLVSADITGLAGGNEASVPLAISTNNRYALFESSASNLVPGDTNGSSDIFVRDLLQGTTLLVSANTSGTPANGASSSPAMTPDGRYVAFASYATDLVPGDTNRIQDVFVRDLRKGLTWPVSGGAAATFSTQGSEAPVMTPDGRFVAFVSGATNVVPGVSPRNGGTEIYLRDEQSGTTLWVSADARTTVTSISGPSFFSASNQEISEDGQYVVFEGAKDFGSAAMLFRYHVPSGITQVLHTNAANMSVAAGMLAITPNADRVAFVANVIDTSGYTTAVAVWDAATGETILASAPIPAGELDFFEATMPALNRSGRYVSFVSDIPGLVTNEVTEGYHAYVTDLDTGLTILVNDTGDGTASPLELLDTPSLSANGRVVAFTSPDSSLVSRDHNRFYDVFVRDLSTNTFELVSGAHPALLSITPNSSSTLAPGTVSGNGRYIAFRSSASDLVEAELGGHIHIFLRDATSGANELISVNTDGTPANGTSIEAVMSSDGRYVAFTSHATNLAPGVSSPVANVFIRDRLAKTTALVSVDSSDLGGGNYDSTSPLISSDGRFVFFYSSAGNLAPGYSYVSGLVRLYMRDLQAGTTALVCPYHTGKAAATPDGHFLACAASSRITSTPRPLDRLFVWDSLATRRVYTNGTTSSSDLFGDLAISPDGSRIAFLTNSLVGPKSLHALDWAAKTNWLIAPVSLRSAPQFSSDSRFLAFSGLPTSGTTYQIYLHDFHAGATLLVSRSFQLGTNANGHSELPAISPDGRFVAYESSAADIVPGDLNESTDIFIFDRLTGSTTLLTASRSGLSSANAWSGTPVFSPDGSTLVFQSWASDLLRPFLDFNNWTDVFAFHMETGGDIPLFRASLSASADGLFITWPALSGKAYRVQFKDNLSDPNWQDLPSGATILGNQGRLHQPASGANRFYRIVAD